MSDALLLDIGGTAHLSTFEVMDAVARRRPDLAPLLARRGPLGPEPDPGWDAMLRREVSERGYWAGRAAEIGRATGATTGAGEEWTTRQLLEWLYDDAFGDAMVRPETRRLVDAAQAAGRPVGILTNDLSAFHDQDWIDAQPFFAEMDALVDCSVLGVLKPAPETFRAAAAALDRAPADVVYLDDLPFHVEGARAVGMTAFLVDLTAPGGAFEEAGAALGLDPVRVSPSVEG